MPPEDPQDANATPRPHSGQGSDGIVFTIGLIAIAFLAHELQWILLPFVVSGLIAFLCTPLVDWSAARFRKPRWVASVSVFCLLILLLVIAILLVARPLLSEFAHSFTAV